MSSIDEKIEAFLKANPNTIYSLKTIAYNVGEKRRKVFFHLDKNKNIHKCKPLEVGSYKHNLKIFTITSKR
tara:strand:+ start:96 stop:308 length:213 start_codon:yes stop_codon:yes gene_type:complete